MTKRMNIPFSPPDISDAEVEEVAKALKSGWITTGPRVKQLEKKIAEYIGVPTEAPNCVCLNSQTACAELALRLLGVVAMRVTHAKLLHNRALHFRPVFRW